MSFTDLDDPTPFTPDDHFRDDAKRRGRRLRNRRRLGLLSVTSILAVVLVVGGFTLYERHKAQQIVRIDVAASLDIPTAPTGTAAAGVELGSFDTPLNVLVVGSDTRALGDDGPVGTANTDTMMIVRLDPRSRHISVLSLPRDLYVDIPGHGQERLNTAWQTGGPQLLIDTIKQNYRVPIHHYIGVDFNGFRRLVDQAGGVDVFASVALRDTNTGFDTQPGCVHLDGNGALSLARSRHLTRVDGGRQEEDVRSDLGRIQRQQLLARILASSLLSSAPTPAAADQLLDTLVESATLDSTWALKDMAAVVHWARDLNLDHDITMYVPPVRGGMAGQASVLYLDDAIADPIFTPFRGDVTPTPSTTVAGTPSTTAVSTAVPPTTTSTVAGPNDPATWITACP